jgi:hypothetical protein
MVYRSSRPRLGLLGVAVVALLCLALLTACGGDDNPTTDNATQATRPEDVKVPMAEVLQKLPTIVAGGEAAAAAAGTGDFDTALAEYEELHEVWEEIEGTIKDTDLDSYEKLETAQSLIRDGAENDDAARVEKGAADQATTANAFIAANGS